MSGKYRTSLAIEASREHIDLIRKMIIDMNIDGVVRTTDVTTTFMEMQLRDRIRERFGHAFEEIEEHL